MNIFDVENLDKHISPLTPAQIAGVSLSGICKSKNIKKNHLCFINGKAPLSEVLISAKEKGSKILNEMVFIVDEKFYDKQPEELNSIPTDLIALTKNFDEVMCLVSKFFYEQKYVDTQYLLDGRQTGEVNVCPTARIAQGVFIGESVNIESNVVVMPGCVIMGGVTISQNTVLYPNCTIYPETKIGKNCLIHAGTVIGSDGYGYNFMQGEHRKIWHIGGVSIGSEVEIGANCTIDRGTFDDTIVEDGTKLDNLVHIAHNCHLKKGVIICAQSGLAGSVTVGQFSAMSGHVAVAPGVEIGNQCEVVGHSAVFDNVEDKTRLAGTPARPMKEWLRSIAAIRRLTKK